MRQKLDSRTYAVALAALIAMTWGLPAAAQPVCPLPVAPNPTPPNQAPPDIFADPSLFANPTTSNDYHWIHSSTHLQGEATYQKFAPCLFYNPAAGDFPVDLSGMQSALVISNPNSAAANVAITWRDSAGNQIGAIQNITIPAEGTWAQGARRLLGVGFVVAVCSSGPGTPVMARLRLAELRRTRHAVRQRRLPEIQYGNEFRAAA